jgi:replicative DNA helicase
MSTKLFNLHAEADVLSAIIHYSGLGRARNLRPEMFYNPRNMKIFQICLALDSKGIPIDLINMLEELEISGEKDTDAFSTIITDSTVASGAHTESHADKIIDRWKRREAIKQCEVAINLQNDLSKTPDEINSDLKKSLTRLDSSTGRSIISLDQVIKESIESMDGKRKNPNKYSITTGFQLLDKITGGFIGGTLWGLGARNSMGKSDLMINLAYHASKDFPVGIFSAEMNQEAISNRLWGVRMKYKRSKLRDSQLSDTEMDDICANMNFENRKIYFDFTSAPALQSISAKIATMVERHKVRVVFIDHLHDLKRVKEHNSDYVNINVMVKTIRDLAREHNIAIVLLMQLNRSTENNFKSDRPRIHHLRESGESECDVVAMLYREGYQVENLDNDILEILIRKNRNGRTGFVNFNYDLTTGIITVSADQIARGRIKKKTNVINDVPF